jgi:hypothetical protein
MIGRFTLVATVGAVLLHASPAAACSCGIFDSPTADRCAKAGRVFAGTIAGYREITGPDLLVRRLGPVEVELAVDRVWRGDVASSVVAYTGRGDGDCGIWLAPGTRFVVCDDAANDAGPEFNFCSHPAFAADSLEGSLGPAFEPPRGIGLTRRIRGSFRIEWALPVLLAIVAALVGRRFRRAATPDPLPRAASVPIPPQPLRGRRLTVGALALGVAAIVTLVLVLRLSVHNLLRDPFAGCGPIVIAGLLGAGVGFEGQRRPSLFRGSGCGFFAAHGCIALVNWLGYMSLPWWHRGW